MTKKITIHITIPRIAPTLNRWQRLHFKARKKEKNAWVQHFMISIGRPKNPIEKCMVSIERYACGVLPDWDNVYCSAKPILDALVTYQVIVDDSPRHIVRLDVQPFTCARADQRTVLIIGEI